MTNDNDAADTGLEQVQGAVTGGALGAARPVPHVPWSLVPLGVQP
jgi:hypothetical protein